MKGESRCRRPLRRWTFAAACALSVLALSTSAGAEPVGGPYEVFRGSASDVRLQTRDRGGVLASWLSSEQLFARSLGPSGPSESAAGFGSATHSAVIENARLGQYLRVWSKLNGVSEYSRSTYAQLVTRTGAPVGERHEILETPDEWMYVTDLVWDRRSRRYVALITVPSEPGTFLEALLLDEQGRKLRVLDLSGASWKHGGASVAVRPDGHFVVAWSETIPPDHAGELRITASVFDASGDPIGPETIVSEHRNLVGERQNVTPDVAVDPESNEAMIVWSDQYEVFGRRLGRHGRPVSSELRLSRMGPPSDPAWLTRSPAVAYNASAKQHLVVWQSGPRKDPYPAGETVYGKLLDRTGGQIGENDFAIATLDRATDPDVAAFSDSSDFLVAWSSQRSSPSAWARRVAPTPQRAPASPPEADPTPDRPPVTAPVVGPVLPDTPPPGPSPQAPPATPSPRDLGSPAPSTGGRGRFAIRLSGKRSLRAFARDGLKASIQCPSSCRAVVRLVVSRRDARQLRSSRVLARRSARVAAGAATPVRLRPPERSVSRLLRRSRLDVTLSVAFTDADGTVTKMRRRGTLRR